MTHLMFKLLILILVSWGFSDYLICLLFKSNHISSSLNVLIGNFWHFEPANAIRKFLALSVDITALILKYGWLLVDLNKFAV